MPCKDQAARRAFQLEWIRKRRLKWLSENGPCVACGSWDRLEVDHKDRGTKSQYLRDYHTGSIWSWAEPRRLAELAKCQALCHICHKNKHASPHGAIRRYKMGCRCTLCTEAKRVTTANYRQSRKQREPNYRAKRSESIPLRERGPAS